MFINIDDSYYLRNLLGKERPEEVLTPQEGLVMGNLFYNTYEPYKHYQPKEIIPKNEQEQMMLRIQELDLAVNDLGLYLDLNPHDQRLYSQYRIYMMELAKISETYNEKYSSIKSTDLKDQYTWYKSPWPWEGNNV